MNDNNMVGWENVDLLKILIKFAIFWKIVYEMHIVVAGHYF